MDDQKILYALGNLSTDAAEKIIAALIEDSEKEAALELIKEYGDCTIFADDGNAEVEYSCDTLKEAANEYVEDGDWSDNRSCSDWVDVYAWRRWTLGDVVIDEEQECFTVEIKPEVPECTEDEHDWCSPYDVVGGLKENPGVFGHGGGVIIHEVCRHCGCLKTTDTWAQRSDTGEQGLTSVEYDTADHQYREAWVQWSENHG